MTARPTKRRGSRGGAVVAIDEIDLSTVFDDASLPTVPVRGGVPVEVQARECVARLGLRAGALFRVECEIAERLPKEERPDWFETDADILDSI